MEETAKYIAEIKSEVDDDYSNDDIYNISSWGADLSFRELIQMYEDDELVKPELQRKYVWDKTEASRFVESVLLGLPVPSIFLAKQQNEKMLIVDGYQRIMTIRDFVRGAFTTDEKIFRLSNSDRINPRWRGKAFVELSDTERRKIKTTTIHAIIFVQDHPKTNDTGMYQIFERINTSGRTLQPQEIRNCVYQGKFNSLLIELNRSQVWRELFNRREEDSRMRDLEFILRFLSMVNTNFHQATTTAISLKKFLNDFMGENTELQLDSSNKFRDQFLTTIQIVSNIFGKDAFFNISQKNPEKVVTKFNPTIFDSIMIATYNAQLQGYEFDDGDYSQKRKLLLMDSSYQDVISTRTTNVENIIKRIDLAKQYLFSTSYEESRS